MKLAIKMQDSERKGERRATIKAIKKFINFMRSTGNSADAIFAQIHHDYHDDVSDEEIRKLISEAK